MRKFKFSYFMQAAVALPVFGLFYLLPIPASSWLGGKIGRIVGLFHGGTQRARHNLRLILPEESARHGQIIRGMWENFGRVLGEYPHLLRMWKKGYITVEGGEYLEGEKSCTLFIAAHLGNWEVAPLTAAQYGWDMAAIYRPLNNHYLDPLLRYARRASSNRLFTKSAEGAMELLRHVRKGESAGVLVDQRLSDGIEVPFFGHPALTTTLHGMLAVKYGARIVPAQVIRERGAHLRIIIHPPVDMPADGTAAEKVEAVVTHVNSLFESWIRQHPEQWLWSHDRWRLKKRKKK